MTAGLLSGEEKHGGDPDLQAQSEPASNRILVRWGKFNLVGACGVGVQFAALFLLKSALHIPYLVATAVAVEIAVLNNFMWHEQFTWADRIRTCVSRHAIGSKRMRLRSWLGFSPGFFRRLWRFHLANGAISIVGNLTMMKALVGTAHMNYLIANLIAIAVCSLGNFMLSDRWVFEN
jgi:putative flippase GtrA